MTTSRAPFLVGGLLLAACASTASPEGGTSAPPPSPIVGGEPAATPATTSGPRITWSEQPFEGHVYAVTVDGDQFVAVGATVDGPAAWTSPDGVTWEPHAVPQPSFLDEYRESINPGADPALFANVARMGPLARLGDTLFSFGTFGGDNDFIRPLGWRSADGTEWEYIESENAFFLQCCGVMELVTGDPGLLAVKLNFAVYSGEIWLWTAGTSWNETTPMKTAETGRSGAEILDAVWADGKFVAVGVAADVESAIPWRVWASSWVSTDGRAWQAAPASGDQEGSVMHSVSPLLGGGFVAVGCETCISFGELGTPAAWTSPDGLTWTEVALPADTDGAAHRVLQLGSGLLAIGAAASGTLTWTSIDGMSWRAGPILAGDASRVIGVRGSTVAARQDQVVLFLTRGDPQESETILMHGVVEP